MRHGSVAIQVQIDDARDAREPGTGLLERGAHHGSLRAEHLEDHLAAHARDRFFDVVLDRLREVVAHSRDLAHLRAHLVHQPVLVVAVPPLVARLQPHERLAHVDALVVGAVLRAADLAQHLRHLGKGEDPAPHLDQRGLSGFERDARRHLDEHDKVALVELGQKLGAEARADPQGEREEHGGCAERQAAARQEPLEPRAIVLAHILDKARLGGRTRGREAERA